MNRIELPLWPHELSAKENCCHARYLVPLRCLPKHDGEGVYVDDRWKPKHYRPKRKRSNQRGITLLSMAYMPPKPWLGPVRLDVLFVFGMYDATRGKRTAWKPSRRDEFRGTPHTNKLDADNCIKQVCDALEAKVVKGVRRPGFYLNDCQICDMRARKIWGDKDAIWIEVEKF